jgi:1,2-diacylglycerol 3-alpha-glucosyltransferase
MRRAPIAHPLRIGIVTATYTPSRNGVATSTALFVRGLRARGHTVRVFASDHPQARPEVDVIRLPGLRSSTLPDYPLLLPVGPIATRMLPIRDFDVIHTMHPFVAGRTALAWARRIDVPLVFTAHTQYHAYVHYAPTPSGVTTWAMRRHVRAFAREADVVLAPGAAIVETLRDYGYAGSIDLMPNPVDLAGYDGTADPALRARFGVPDDAPLAVYVGRMGREKGLPLLLEAFALARRSEPRLHLLMIGDGPLRVELMARAQPQVHWVGGVDHHEVGRHLIAADVFVSASVSEVQPMTFLESLAAGTPVVAVASAAARDLQASGGLTMSAADPVDLARALLETVHGADPLARRQVARTAARAFDVGERAAALEETYRRVIGRLRPPTHGSRMRAGTPL